MTDIAHKATDKKIKKLESQINAVYEEALTDIEGKLNDFAEKYKVKESIHLQELKDGKITQKQFDDWKKGQVFQGKQWEAKRDQVINTIYNSNTIATKIINGSVVDVFAFNANYMSYNLEHTNGVNFGFGIYDNATVVKLIKDDPDILPKWKIDEPKDYVWNKKKVNSAVVQGVIQGEGIDQITKRISKSLVAQNENTMKTFARTAMTGAQNAGRDQSLMDAKSRGINVVKQWMATLDGRTRDSHRYIDGETIKVGDKWHPQKFSNGCRFPGDPEGPPHEVYNCRCTMVGDVQGYPSIYQRYDNIDGKPIKNMTYAEWYKAKNGKEIKPVKFKTTSKIDYSKYGGKETFDILKKYKDVDDMVDNATQEEWKHINSLISSKGINSHELEKLMQESKNEGVKKTVKTKVKQTAEEKAQKEYEKAKADLDKLEQKIKNKGADKVFTGIWKDPVTYADYGDKLISILSKEKYYQDAIKMYEDAGELVKAQYMKDKLKELEEFKNNGFEYSRLLKERDSARQTVQSLKPKPDPSKVFGVDAYSQQRKNAALWAKNSEQADKALRARTGEVWRGATDSEKDAIFEYTDSYSKFNEPLRGWEYGHSDYNTGAGFKGVGNTDLNAGYTNNGKRLNAMTDIIDKCSYDQDVWLQRGCKYNGMDKFFNCDMDLLKNGSQEELEQTLLGTMPTEYGFMSCGSSKGKGFSGNIMLNIYAPEGTKMMYVEPFSAFGNGAASVGWDGVSTQSSLGSELETILQQGTQFRVVKVERSNSKLYFDLEVINQDHQQRWT